MQVVSQCEVFCSQAVAAVSKDINRSFQSYFAAQSSLFSWPCFDGCCSQCFILIPQDFKIYRFLHLKWYFEASLVQLISRDSSPWTWVTLEWNCQNSSPRLSAVFAVSTRNWQRSHGYTHHDSPKWKTTLKLKHILSAFIGQHTPMIGLISSHPSPPLIICLHLYASNFVSPHFPSSAFIYLYVPSSAFI